MVIASVSFEPDKELTFPDTPIRIKEWFHSTYKWVMFCHIVTMGLVIFGFIQSQDSCVCVGSA